jgi:hypothetical protein
VFEAVVEGALQDMEAAGKGGPSDGAREKQVDTRELSTTEQAERVDNTIADRRLREVFKAAWGACERMRIKTEAGDLQRDRYGGWEPAKRFMTRHRAMINKAEVCTPEMLADLQRELGTSTQYGLLPKKGTQVVPGVWWAEVSRLFTPAYRHMLARMPKNKKERETQRFSHGKASDVLEYNDIVLVYAAVAGDTDWGLAAIKRRSDYLVATAGTNDLADRGCGGSEDDEEEDEEEEEEDEDVQDWAGHQSLLQLSHQEEDVPVNKLDAGRVLDVGMYGKSSSGLHVMVTKLGARPGGGNTFTEWVKWDTQMAKPGGEGALEEWAAKAQVPARLLLPALPSVCPISPTL